MSQPVLYKCPVCETVVEVLEDFGLELLCCGRQMQPLRRRLARPGDRHWPALAWDRRGLTVSIGGDQPHPMDRDHCLQWIEVLAANRCYRQYLQPGELPEASFKISRGPVAVRCCCSVHGLWSNRQPEYLCRESNLPASASVTGAG
jgi:superoxide reductase